MWHNADGEVREWRRIGEDGVEGALRCRAAVGESSRRDLGVIAKVHYERDREISVHVEICGISD